MLITTIKTFIGHIWAYMGWASEKPALLTNQINRQLTCSLRNTFSGPPSRPPLSERQATR